jgi:hypothetical protein
MKIRKLFTVILILALLAMLSIGCKKDPDLAQERGYSTAIYKDQGGDRQVHASGATSLFESGSALTLESGSTATFTGATVTGLIPSSIPGNVQITGTLAVSLTSTLVGNVDMQGTLSDSGDDVVIADNTQITGTLAVSLTSNLVGNVTAGGTLDVTGLSNLNGGVYDSSGDLNLNDNVQITGTLDVTSTIQFGADNLYPIGYASSGELAYAGASSSVTQTIVLSSTHGATTAITYAACSVSDPDDDAGDPFLCKVSITDGDVTFQAVQDDGDDASTAATTLYYILIGN